MATPAAKQNRNGNRKKHTAPGEEARLRALFGLAPERPPIPYRFNPANFVHNLQPTGKLTKQGVRDLNGPRQDGSGYNGRRSVSCSHFRSPQTTPTYTTERMLPDLRTVTVTCCAQCGAEIDAVADESYR